MPRLIPFRLAAACALALALSLVHRRGRGRPRASPPSCAWSARAARCSPKRPSAPAPTSVKTSPKATCFGAGTGGSGKSVTIKGATALGLLAQAAKSTAALRPLLITDAFDFGLGALRGRQPAVANGKALLVPEGQPQERRRSAATRSSCKPGDEVLWAWRRPTRTRTSWRWKRPAAATAGVPFEVTRLLLRRKGQAQAGRRGDGDRRQRRRPTPTARTTVTLGGADAAARHPRQGHPLQRRSRSASAASCP